MSNVRTGRRIAQALFAKKKTLRQGDRAEGVRVVATVTLFQIGRAFHPSFADEIELALLHG
jgi:hypothetical protein